MGQWTVYILKCADNSYYVGYTHDLDCRLKAHDAGSAARYTRDRRPVLLVFNETCDTESKAIHRERQLKRWSHAKKKALICGDTSALKELAKPHSFLKSHSG
ncbi:MAG: GIY-YIG nuclease family protein [Lentisphaeria bacterium]|nr:GIY-YIG nuclease family protein [Lentisphaeria bacterium]